MPTSLAVPARMQGRDVSANSIFILRSEDEFTMHRPKGMELLALTFDSERFDRFLDATGTASAGKGVLSHPVIDVAGESLHQLRTTVRAVLAGGPVLARAALDADGGTDAALEGLLFTAVAAVLSESPTASALSGRRSTASYIVEDTHRLATGDGGAALTIEDICQRLRASRRTVQSSFNAIAEVSPVRYLRSLRLNAVRRQLLTTCAEDVGVGQLAKACGFAHLGHFASEYEALFGELPSRTLRACVKGPGEEG